MADVYTDEHTDGYEAPRIEGRNAIGPMLIGIQLNSNIKT